MMQKNIILVHGSFHTGECWYLLRPLLENRGFTVHTPTMRGQRGNPRNPFLVTMQGYVDDVLQCVAACAAPRILLGHSLAGLAISAAAERRPELIEKLIYLAAAIPKIGKSGLREMQPADMSKSPKLKLRPAISFPAEAAKELFYNCCPADVQSKAVSILSPQPLRPLLGTIRTTASGLGAVDKYMIACAHDRVVPLDEQLMKQSNQDFKNVQTLDSDHSPFLSAAQALADAIERIAKE